MDGEYHQMEESRNQQANTFSCEFPDNCPSLHPYFKLIKKSTPKQNSESEPEPSCLLLCILNVRSHRDKTAAEFIREKGESKKRLEKWAKAVHLDSKTKDC